MEIFKNIFTEEELEAIHTAIENAGEKTVDSGGTPLGRMNIAKFNIPESAIDKIKNLANFVAKKELGFNGGGSCVLSSNKYGQPNLPPHFDGDKNELIVDYQLSSNTNWGIGVNMEVYELEDNSAIAFNPNTNIHWRPHKEFKDGEYVTMLFFRFFDTENRIDYSYVPMNQTDDAFKDVRALRDSLK